jgi:DnaK suppressor protein
MATKAKTPSESAENAATDPASERTDPVKTKPKQQLTPESAESERETIGNDDAETASMVNTPAVTPAAAGQNQKWVEIRVILEKLKEDTLREIRKSVKNGTEAVAAIEPGGDIYDQASSERDRELGLLLGDREREKIHNIDEALLRIDDGDYGICEECDEDIPLGRLKAMPFTRHCVKCKSDLEKLQAQTKRVEEERAYREIPLGEDEE